MPSPISIPLSLSLSTLVGWLMVGALARRQERSKGRLAAETAIRTAVARIRSDVVHVVVAAPFAAANGVEVPRLTDAMIDMFAEDVINAAYQLSERRQQQVRALLVELLGEGRVRLAEEIGPTVARLRESGEEGLAKAGRTGWVLMDLMPTGVEYSGGSLKAFTDNPWPEQRNLIERQLDQLTRMANGRLGLAGRKDLPPLPQIENASPAQ